MKFVLLLSISLLTSFVTYSQQVMKVNEKYGAIERDTTILNPIYDTVYMPNKDYSLYIFGKDGKYGYHITYGCDVCYEKLSFETSDLIYDSIYKNYKNYIFQKDGKWMYKSVKHIAEFKEAGWNRPVRYHLRHFENPESQWYDSIIVDRKIQKIVNLEDVLLLKNNGLYGLFTRYGGGENVHGSVTECIWDSIQAYKTLPIFMVWKEGKMHYLNAETNKFTSESFKPGEMETYWNPMEVKQHGKPIRFFNQETMTELYTVMDNNGNIIRDTLHNYILREDVTTIGYKDLDPREYLRVYRNWFYVSNNSSNNLESIYTKGSLQYALDKYSSYDVLIYNSILINDTLGKNLLSFNENNWVYDYVPLTNFNYDPILGYDLSKLEPNHVNVSVFCSRNGELIKKFEKKAYYITCSEGEFRAIKIKGLELLSDSILRLTDSWTKYSKRIKTLGYYSYNKKKNEYEVVRFKWMVNKEDGIILD